MFQKCASSGSTDFYIYVRSTDGMQRLTEHFYDDGVHVWNAPSTNSQSNINLIYRQHAVFDSINFSLVQLNIRKRYSHFYYT